MRLPRSKRDTDPMNRLATKQQKALLYVTQDGDCAVCGSRLEQFEADHVVPWSLGGSTNTENLQLLCKPCHSAKTLSQEKAKQT